jgi:hypothetical protein
MHLHRQAACPFVMTHMTHSQISGQLDEALNRVCQGSFLATDNTQSTFSFTIAQEISFTVIASVVLIFLTFFFLTHIYFCLICGGGTDSD